MPSAPPEIIHTRAEALRRGVQILDTSGIDRALGPVTISIGVAIYPAHGDTGPAVMQRADAALYQAKQSGRNRVVVAGP